MTDEKDIIPLFPLIFYFLGLFTESFRIIVGGWESWLIIGLGIGLYLLFYIWFMYELNLEKLK
jgi:hypothetical protein